MNRNLLIGAASFLAGAALGFGAGYIFLKEKFKKISDKEIESVREAYQKMKDNVYQKKPLDQLAEKYKETNEAIKISAADRRSLNDILKGYGAEFDPSDDNTIDLTKARQEMEARQSVRKALKEAGERPYEISEEEFGEFEDYTTIGLTYYSDGIVADERDLPLDDMERIIGSSWQDDFDTICYIRNDALKCDYEITSDPRLYSDILKESPYLRSEI